MKILVLTSRFPYPLEKGDKLRIYYQMRELAARGHEIVLAALTEHAVEPFDYQQVSAFCSAIYVHRLRKFGIFQQILAQILRGGKLPFQVAYFFNAGIKNEIDRLIEAEKPDHIYCHLARMAPYVLTQKLPKTLDYMDAFGAGSERRAQVARLGLAWLWRIETRRMLAFEQSLFQQFDRTTIIAAQDRAWLPLTEAQQNEVVVVPNGVDTQHFNASETIENQLISSKNGKNTEGGIFSNFSKTSNIAPTEKPYDVCFVGNLGYYSNVAAVQFLVHKILPLLQQHKPHIKILLAGARPSVEVQKLASESVIVKGWFDDIRTAYAASKIMVAPLMHGTGQQNKILEAMAMGVPVVTTTRVNNAIAATPDAHILLADTEGVFATQILRLLDDDNQQKTLAENARQFVVAQYSWAARVAELEKCWA